MVLEEMGPRNPTETVVPDQASVAITISRPANKDLPFLSSFADGREYFEALKEVALDETIAMIASNLEENLDTCVSIELDFVTAAVDCEKRGDRGLVVVEMSSVGGGSAARVAAAIVDELNRPGNVFLLYPSKAKSKMKAKSTTADIDGTNSKKQPTEWDPLQCLAVVAQGARASLIQKTNKLGGMARLPGQSSSSSTELPLWLSTQCLLAKTLLNQVKQNTNISASSSSSSQQQQNKHSFTAVCLGSVLQYQRMVVACKMYPEPPFLSSLLGHGPGTDKGTPY